MPRAMSYRGRRGCPDYFFFGHGRVVLMEFKRPSRGSLSPAQRIEHERLADAGLRVHVVKTVSQGKSALRAAMRE